MLSRYIQFTSLCATECRAQSTVDFLGRGSLEGYKDSQRPWGSAPEDKLVENEILIIIRPIEHLASTA